MICDCCHASLERLKVYAHGHVFCSMKCADVWEADPANTEAVTSSYRDANCSAYLDCVIATLCNRSEKPPFISCDANCPLRDNWKCE
jgi:hypothetical protein